MGKSYDVISFILRKSPQVTFILRKLKLANFADIIKIATIFIRTTFKDSNKVKRNRNYALKYNLFLYFLI